MRFLVMKKTTEQFIEEAKAIHGDKYDYSETVYYGSRVNCEIRCKKHGVFKQLPTNHLKGRGCNKCGYDKSSAKNSITLDELNNRLLKFDNITYVSGLVDYNTDCLFRCSVHGEFEKKPSLLVISKYGCTKCAEENGVIKSRRLTKDEFLDRVKHLPHIDFSMSNYVSMTKPITFYCKTHSKYHTALPYNIRYSYGCNECGDESSASKQTGFLNTVTVERNKAKYLAQSNHLYIFKLNEYENVYKIGIARQISTRKQKLLKDFGDCELVGKWKINTYCAFYIEQTVIQDYTALKFNIDNKTNDDGTRKRGWTELFSLDDMQLKSVMSTVDELVELSMEDD